MEPHRTRQQPHRCDPGPGELINRHSPKSSRLHLSSWRIYRDRLYLPGKVTRGPGGSLKTRCKYIPVRSMAASLRPTVLSHPPGPRATVQTVVSCNPVSPVDLHVRDIGFRDEAVERLAAFPDMEVYRRRRMHARKVQSASIDSPARQHHPLVG